MTERAPIHPNLAVHINGLSPVIRDFEAFNEFLHHIVFDEMATHDAVVDFTSWCEHRNRLGYLVERLAQHIAELRKVSRSDTDAEEQAAAVDDVLMDLERAVDIFDQLTQSGVVLDDPRSVQTYRDRTEHMLADLKDRVMKLREVFEAPTGINELDAAPRV